jgi:tRNA pseudouridine38-40 synthase
MTRQIGLRLAYEGTRYSGWQIQPERQTVQGSVTAAIREVSGEEVLVRGSSRTDAGVHALDQVAAFAAARDFSADVWGRALNATLPADITVVAAREVAASFDPIAAARRKRYRYRIHDAVWKPVLTRPFVWRWRGRLDASLMHSAATALVGEHDFTSFETTPSTRASKVRTIHSLSVFRPALADATAAEVWIEVEGNGFLHNMVRIIAGSLVMVGAGRRPPEWLAEALAARCRPAAGPTAPPEGLVLVQTTLDSTAWPDSPNRSAP